MQQDGDIHKQTTVPDIVEVVLDIFVYQKGTIGAQLP
jgi:hypothetical protein